MYSISIGEIQKNISLLTQLTEVFAIIDRRKNRQVAIVYPIKTHSIVSSMAGKYRDRVDRVDDLEIAKQKAMSEALGEKYGLSD
jgi:hypothetical protein